MPVPGNDDAIRSIRLICTVLAEAVVRGRGEALEGAEVATESGQAEGAVAEVDAILKVEKHEEESVAILEQAKLSRRARGDWRWGTATASATCATSTTERESHLGDRLNKFL